MEPQRKLTKQGVRDLNHLGPKKAPTAAVAESAVADAAHPVPPPAAVLESAAIPTVDVSVPG
jgi:hypothetical protein